MQSLISAILAGSEAGIEAVEALLLLAEWVSHRPQGHNPVGRGEEDRVAWMYIGTALRLGYFLDLDRATFSRGPPGDLTVELVRRRLVWIGRRRHSVSETAVLVLTVSSMLHERPPGVCEAR